MLPYNGNMSFCLWGWRSGPLSPAPSLSKSVLWIFWESATYRKGENEISILTSHREKINGKFTCDFFFCQMHVQNRYHFLFFRTICVYLCVWSLQYISLLLLFQHSSARFDSCCREQKIMMTFFMFFFFNKKCLTNLENEIRWKRFESSHITWEWQMGRRRMYL